MMILRLDPERVDGKPLNSCAIAGRGRCWSFFFEEGTRLADVVKRSLMEYSEEWVGGCKWL